MFYFVMFFVLLLLGLLNIQMHDRLSRQLLMVFSSIILICIAGLRYETGGDWDSYTKLFASFPSLHYLVAHPQEWFGGDVEGGFVLLCAAVKTMGGGIQTLFFVVTFVDIVLIASVLPKYTKYPVVALFGYYCLLYFQLEMIYMRQATAVALCFFALQYIEDGKWLRYMVVIFVACTFHRVAIVMIPLYFLLDKRLPAWLYMCVIGAGALLMLAGVPWIKSIFLAVSSLLGETYAEKAEAYTTTDVFATGRQLSVGFVLNLLMAFCFLFFKKPIDERRNGTIMLNMYMLSLVLYYYCYELVEVSNRFRLFFNIGIIALLPILLECLPKVMDRFVGYVVVCLYCFSFSMGIFLEKPQAVAYNPYQNYVEFKIHPRPSTGAQRLKQSEWFFQQGRK